MSARPYFKKSYPEIPILLRHHLSLVSSAFNSESVADIATLLPCNLELFSSQYAQALRNDINSLGYPSAIENTVESLLPQVVEQWPGFSNSVIKWCEVVKASDVRITDSSGVHLDDATDNQIRQDFSKSMMEYAKALSGAFSHAKGVLLCDLVKGTVKSFIDLATLLDLQRGDGERTLVRAMADMVNKFFTGSLQERPTINPDGTRTWRKRNITLDLANQMFRIYNKIGNTRLTKTIFDQLYSNSVQYSPEQYTNSALCLYHYNAGIYHLQISQFLIARASLLESFRLCFGYPNLSKQRKRIIVPLLVVNIILGIYPEEAFFKEIPEARPLAHFFVPLIHALKNGDFRTFRMAMGQEYSPSMRIRRRFWEQHNVYEVLQNRLQPQLWLGLLRAVHRVHSKLEPERAHMVLIRDLWIAAKFGMKRVPRRNAATQAPPQTGGLFYQSGDKKIAAEPTWWNGGMQDLQLSDVESAVMSLIDQGLIRGYLGKSGKDKCGILVMSRKEGAKNWEDWSAVWESRPWAAWKNGAKTVVEGRQGMVGGGAGGVVRLSGVKMIGE